MSKIKVGDKVKILKDSSGDLGEYTGTIQEIEEIKCGGAEYYMKGLPKKIGSTCCFWWERELELVKTKFTMDDLKTGYIVETRNGHKLMVFAESYENKKQMIEADNGHRRWDFSDYRDDLTPHSDDNWDIMKVFKAKTLVQAFRHFDSNSEGYKEDMELVWERESEKEVKLNKVISDLEQQLTNAKEELKGIRGE
jgi:hypothetical protein